MNTRDTKFPVARIAAVLSSWSLSYTSNDLLCVARRHTIGPMVCEQKRVDVNDWASFDVKDPVSKGEIVVGIISDNTQDRVQSHLFI